MDLRFGLRILTGSVATGLGFFMSGHRLGLGLDEARHGFSRLNDFPSGGGEAKFPFSKLIDDLECFSVASPEKMLTGRGVIFPARLGGLQQVGLRAVYQFSHLGKRNRKAIERRAGKNDLFSLQQKFLGVQSGAVAQLEEPTRHGAGRGLEHHRHRLATVGVFFQPKQNGADGDGLVDCVDSECVGLQLCAAELCSNGIDDDLDGDFDCEDSECDFDPACSATGEICDNQLDEDGDGDIDVLSSAWDDNQITWYENRPTPDIGSVEQEFVHPPEGGHVLTLVPGEIFTGADIANRALPGEISGTKFEDLNSDGVHDDGEPGLPGWTIYFDQDGDAVYDPGEPARVTDSQGYYEFIDLLPLVEYRVREVPQDGWLQTLPTSNSYLLAMGAGQSFTNTNFGNVLIPGEIHGTKYRDDDGDGVRDADEPGLADWTIYLDTNQNGIFNGGEPTTTTDADGRYAFTDLEAVTTYHVGEVQQLGYLQTSPVPTTGDTNVGVDPFATDSLLQTAWDITDVTDGNFFVTGLDGVGSGFNSQALFRVSADGSSVSIQTPANQPRGITADEEYLYWLDTALSGSGMGVFRRPLEGGAREQIVDGPASVPVITSARDIQFTTVDGVPTLVVSDDTAGRLFTVTLGGVDAVVQHFADR